MRQHGVSDKDKLAKAIRAIKYDGVLGQTTFDPTGQTQVSVDISLYVVKGGKWDQMISSIRRQAKARAQDVLSLSRRPYTGLAAHITTLEYTALVRPRLEYACAIWGPSVSVEQAESLEVVQNNFARNLFNLGFGANPHFITGELGLHSLSSRRMEQSLRYWGKLSVLPATRLIRFLFDTSLARIRQRRGKHLDQQGPQPHPLLSQPHYVPCGQRHLPPRLWIP
jgi:hypothetical protein